MHIIGLVSAGTNQLGLLPMPSLSLPMIKRVVKIQRLKLENIYVIILENCYIVSPKNNQLPLKHQTYQSII